MNISMSDGKMSMKTLLDLIEGTLTYMVRLYNDKYIINIANLFEYHVILRIVTENPYY